MSESETEQLGLQSSSNGEQPIDELISFLEESRRQMDAVLRAELIDAGYQSVTAPDNSGEFLIPDMLSAQAVESLYERIPHRYEGTSFELYYVESSDIQEARQSQKYQNLVEKRREAVSELTQLVSEIAPESHAGESFSNREVVQQTLEAINDTSERLPPSGVVADSLEVKRELVADVRDNLSG